jgi:hypothetical protein
MRAMPNKRPIKYDAAINSKSVANAYFAAVLASLAYKPQLVIESELRELGYPDTKVLFFRTALTSGFILEWGEVIAVSFKGSSTWREWVNNLNFWFKQTPYGRIHAGFYHTIEEVGPLVYRMILPGLLSGAKVVITGHSRGGALAILMGFMLELNGFCAHAVYTFGSPKIGDQEFANQWRQGSELLRVRRLPTVLVYLLTWVGTLCLAFMLGFGMLKARLLRLIAWLYRPASGA